MLAVVGAVFAVALVPVAVSAAHTFTDVPDSNIFHSDISWLADAGVTAGCNPPTNDQFCPSDGVTREQMAAFMHRLADNQVVDAASVLGVVPAVGLTEIKWNGVSSTAAVTLDSFEVTVPAAGTILIDVSGNIFLNRDSNSVNSVAASGVVAVCTAGAVLNVDDCGVGWDRGVVIQDPDNADDTIFGGPNATPGVSRGLLFEAPSAGTYTFYVNGFGLRTGGFIIFPGTAVPFSSYAMTASATYSPATLEMTAASAPADATADQGELATE